MIMKAWTMQARVRIQSQDFNLADEIAALRSADARVGAVCSFIGTVRDRNAKLEGAPQPQAPILSMQLEHYPGMTEKSIEAMIDEAHKRFDIFGARHPPRGPVATAGSNRDGGCDFGSQR